MRLADIMALRGTVGAGLLVAVTDRCPMSCAHCSFASTLHGHDLDAGRLMGFLGTFAPADHPEVVLFTGGEPMMRPDVVADAARRARASGASTAVLTGAYFARSGTMPAPVRRAIAAVDHLSVSLDVFHEREVPRGEAFRLLRHALDLGVAASAHIVGMTSDDPYLAEVTGAVTAAFGDEVPMLVSEVRPIGRGTAFAGPAGIADTTGIAPCAMAAWPVIAPDGTITACCNQQVVDGADRPHHLGLGRVTESWPAVHARTRTRGLLRMIRTTGPGWIAARETGDGRQAPDVCTLCRELDQRTGPGGWADELGAGRVGALLEPIAIDAMTRQGPSGVVRRYGSPRYAHLVGTPSEQPPSGSGR